MRILQILPEYIEADRVLSVIVPLKVSNGVAGLTTGVSMSIILTELSAKATYGALQ